MSAMRTSENTRRGLLPLLRLNLSNIHHKIFSVFQSLKLTSRSSPVVQPLFVRNFSWFSLASPHSANSILRSFFSLSSHFTGISSPVHTRMTFTLSLRKKTHGAHSDIKFHQVFRDPAVDLSGSSGVHSHFTLIFINLPNLKQHVPLH